MTRPRDMGTLEWQCARIARAGICPLCMGPDTLPAQTHRFEVLDTAAAAMDGRRDR